MNNAAIDALLAILGTIETPKTYYVVTAEGQHRLSRITIESIDAQLNCTIRQMDAGSNIKTIVSAWELHDTPDDALTAFDIRATTERAIAEQDQENWNKDG